MSESNRDTAVALALERPRQELLALPAGTLAARFPTLGLPLAEDPKSDAVALRFLERSYTLRLEDLHFEPEPDPVRSILMLRYLTCPQPLQDDGEPLAFRELPGAGFYLGPFRARSVDPLAIAVGENRSNLERAAAHFEALPVQRGDAAWRFTVLGTVWLELVWYAPDEEFPANCELLFAPCVARIYRADEAAMLGSLLCMNLLRRL
jgi:hypothetical protein